MGGNGKRPKSTAASGGGGNGPSEKRRRGGGAHSRAPAAAAAKAASGRGGGGGGASGSGGRGLTASALRAHDSLQDASRCSICKAHLDSEESEQHGDFFVCVAGCKEIWAGCMAYRSLESVAQERQQNSTFQKFFLDCGRVQKGERPKDFFPSRVAELDKQSSVTERRYIGMTRSEFKDAFGEFPEVLGLKLVPNLKDEYGKPYKGVLFHDPQHPFRVHVVRCGAEHNLAKFHMPPEAQAHEDQGAKTYEWLTADTIKEMGNKSAKAWSFEEIRDKVAEYRNEKCEETSAAGDDEKSAGKSPGAFTRVSAPMLGAPSAWGDALENMSYRSSPGAKGQPSRWKTIKVVKGDIENHKKIASYWLGKLDPAAAMKGAALGKEKREAEDAAERLHNAESPALAIQLREAVGLINEAEKLQAAAIDDMAMGVLSETVAKVVAIGVPFPEEVKMALLKRYASHAFSNEDMTGMLNIISPWKEEGLDILFDPSAPRLRDISGESDMGKRYAWFEQYFVDMVLVSLMQKNEDGMKALHMVSKAALEFLLKINDDDDESEEEQQMIEPKIPKEIEKNFHMLLGCVRAACYLANMVEMVNIGVTAAMTLEFYDRVGEFDRKKETPQSRLAAMLRTGVWAQRLASAKALVSAESAASTFIDDAKVMLRKKPTYPRDLLKVMDTAARFKEQVRPSSLEPLLSGLRIGVVHWVEKYKETAEAMDDRSDRDNFFNELAEVFRTAPCHLPDLTKECDGARVAAAKAKIDMAKHSSLHMLLTRLPVLDMKTSNEQIKKLAAQAKGEKLKIGTDAVTNEQAEPITKAINQALDTLGCEGHDFQPRDMGTMIDSIEALVDLYSEGGGMYKDFTSKVVAWRELHDLMELGQNDSEIMKADFLQTSFTDRKIVMATSQRLLQKFSGNKTATNAKPEGWDPIFEKVTATMEKAKGIDTKGAYDQVQDTIKNIEEKAARLWDDRWHENLPLDAKLPEVLDHAKSDENLVYVNGVALDSLVAALQANMSSIDEIYGFFGFAVESSLKTKSDDTAKKAMRLITQGCLVAALRSSKTAAEARKLVGKAMKKAKKYDIGADGLSPPALAAAAKDVMNYIFTPYSNTT